VPAYCWKTGASEAEHLFIDNRATDRILRCRRNSPRRTGRREIIVNPRNFGPIRSTYEGGLAAQDDAVISSVKDLSDTPALMIEFAPRDEAGFKIIAVSRSSRFLDHRGFWIIAVSRSSRFLDHRGQ
jgi:polyisoprenyl-phosphate glycosyltransferase